MTNEDLILIQHLYKNYGKTVALNDVSFSIPHNSIFGLLGPNGSGKSTFMRILSGLIIQWNGKISWGNLNIRLNQKQFLKKCGFLIESPTFYEYLTAHQNLSILARVSNCKPDTIERVLNDVNLFAVIDKKVGDFSYGMKQRLGIAQAILHDPDILFLDEPNNGLDPLGIKEMNETILKLNKQGKTICVSTHILNDVEELCTDIAILKEGKLILANSLDTLLNNSDIILIKSDEPQKIKHCLIESKTCDTIYLENNNLIIKTRLNVISIAQLIPNNIQIKSIVKSPNLSQYFK